MSYTDQQACITLSVDGDTPRHARTIPEWAARDKSAADEQRAAVRAMARKEQGNGPRLTVAIFPGYCPECRAQS